MVHGIGYAHYRVHSTRYRQDAGYRVQGKRLQGIGHRVQGTRVHGTGYRAQGTGYKGTEYRV